MIQISHRQWRQPEALLGWSARVISFRLVFHKTLRKPTHPSSLPLFLGWNHRRIPSRDGLGADRGHRPVEIRGHMDENSLGFRKLLSSSSPESKDFSSCLSGCIAEWDNHLGCSLSLWRTIWLWKGTCQTAIKAWSEESHRLGTNLPNRT